MKSDLELSDFVITSPYTMTSADIKAVSKASNGNPQKEGFFHCKGNEHGGGRNL